MTAPIRVLVVDDSLTVREHMAAVLGADPELEIVGQAADGQAAIDLCRDLRPDVITLDMQMPLLDGLSATEHIMGHVPTPILIVSSSTNRGDLFRTYDALAAGAVDVLEKPRLGESDDGWNERFVRTVKLVSRIKVITHPRARIAAMRRSNAPAPPAAPRAPHGPHASGRIVAIGASTGGPAALVSVLSHLSQVPRVTILIVQHIDRLFAPGFVEWLGNQTGRRIREATDGQALMTPEGGTWMPTTDAHLVARDGRLWLERSAPRHACRPSIDLLFESLAAEAGPRVVACLLTGMGKDGASGLLAIRSAGGSTFAQDEATCVVYGMPREAARLGAAQRILSLPEIGPSIVRELEARGA